MTAARTLSEAAWTRTVIDAAKTYGWRVHHARPALRQSGRWSTPVQGHIGAPDLLLARDGDVLCAELKVGRNRLSTDQEKWAAALGVHGRLWRPADVDAVIARLRRTP